MQTETVLSVLSVTFLAALHPLSVRLSQKHIRKRVTSLCAGIALAYVFLHLLPELANMQYELIERGGENRPNPWFREHVYILALAGLLLFQIIDSMGRSERKVTITPYQNFSYKAEILFFALYSALIGYLIVGNAELDQPILLITIALAAHFFGTDLDLAERYGSAFRRLGSYVLSIATLGGMILALVIQVNETAVMAGFSFLAGGLLINTLRTELPEPEQVKNLFLLAGSALYSLLILLIYMRSRT